MITHKIRWRIPLIISVLSAMSLFLTACGGIPIVNYAGISTDGESLFMANQNFLWSINPGTASVNWRYPEKADQAHIFYSAPAVKDGWLFVGSYQNVAYGFDLSTTKGAFPSPTWAFESAKDKGRMVGAPAAADGVVVFPSSDQNLYALDAKTGVLKWKYEAEGALWASPVIAEGRVYQAGMGHFIYALDLNTGEEFWKTDLGGPVLAAPALGEGGRIFVGTQNKEVMALDSADGKVEWAIKLDGSLWNQPLVLDDRLIFGADSNQLYFLNTADGSEFKRIQLNSSAIASPRLAGDALVVLTEGGEVITFSKDGETRGWTAKQTKGKLYSSPAVFEDQIVIAPFQGDHLLAGYSLAGEAQTKWDSFTGK